MKGPECRSLNLARAAATVPCCTTGYVTTPSISPDSLSSESHASTTPDRGGDAVEVNTFHSHAIPLDMEDIERDWDRPVTEAGIAAKASIIVRVGMLDLGAGTGSFRVREMMHRMSYPLGVHVRADVNLTDIEATCTDGHERITEVVDLPTTGVNGINAHEPGRGDGRSSHDGGEH